jgi:hypothetical protein
MEVIKMICKNAIDFSAGQPAGKILVDWWKNLDESTISSLKHRKDLFDFLCENDAFHELYNELGFKLHDDDQNHESFLALLSVATVVMHVKTNTTKSLMTNFGSSEGNPKFKESKYDKLRHVPARCEMSDAKEEYQELCDIIKYILKATDGRANINDLANAVYNWDDEVKTQWTFQFFNSSFSHSD